MSIKDLALKHGALLFNEGVLDEHYLITETDLRSLIYEVAMNATTNERNACALLILRTVKGEE